MTGSLFNFEIRRFLILKIKFISKRVVLNPSHQTFEERTKVVEKVLLALKANSEFDQLQGWRNEHYFVRSRFSEMPKFSLERAGASLFGIKCYGCHINGYIKKNNEYFMWIARRSFTKPTYPGMLDNFVKFFNSKNQE